MEKNKMFFENNKKFYFPVKTGFLFSLKAAKASKRSLEGMVTS
jgi:hypothetical protein